MPLIKPTTHPTIFFHPIAGGMVRAEIRNAGKRPRGFAPTLEGKRHILQKVLLASYPDAEFRDTQFEDCPCGARKFTDEPVCKDCRLSAPAAARQAWMHSPSVEMRREAAALLIRHAESRKRDASPSYIRRAL
jgi:hypothetical protein